MSQAASNNDKTISDGSTSKNTKNLFQKTGNQNENKSNQTLTSKIETIKASMEEYNRIKQLHEKSLTKEERPILVLSIDGGGLRGVITCQLLKELEKQLQELSGNSNYKIHNAFDLIVGTSTGGLLALGLGRLKYTVDECESMYDYVAKHGFIRTWSSWLTFNGSSYLYSSKYNQDELKQSLENYKNKKKEMHDTLYDKNTDDNDNSHCLVGCVVTCQLNENAFPMLLRSYKHKEKDSTLLPNIPGTCQKSIKIIDAALATGAAPTYFPPLEKKIQLLDGSNETKKVLFIDGGVSSNHPHMIAALEAKTLWPNRRVFVMSFGTGTTESGNINGLLTKNDGAAEKAPNPVKAAFSAFDTKELVTLYAMSVLRGLDLVDFSRFNPSIEKDKSEMDTVENMKYWKETGKKYVNDIPYIKPLIKMYALVLLNAQKHNIMDELHQ